MGGTDHRIATLRRAYELFNDKDVDGLMALLDPEIEWPDMTGGPLRRGKAAVRLYWESVFSVASPRVVPHDFLADGDSVIAVVERQVYDLEGHSLGSSAVVVHRVVFRDDHIARISITTSDLETPRQVLEVFRRAGQRGLR